MGEGRENARSKLLVLLKEQSCVKYKHIFIVHDTTYHLLTTLLSSKNLEAGPGVVTAASGSSDTAATAAVEWLLTH